MSSYWSFAAMMADSELLFKLVDDKEIEQDTLQIRGIVSSLMREITPSPKGATIHIAAMRLSSQ